MPSEEDRRLVAGGMMMMICIQAVMVCIKVRAYFEENDNDGLSDEENDSDGLYDEESDSEPSLTDVLENEAEEESTNLEVVTPPASTNSAAQGSSSTSEQSTAASRKRKRSVPDFEDLNQILVELAESAKEVASSFNKPSQLPIVFEMLKAIPDFSEAERLRALDMLARDAGAVEIFLALDEALRYEWLLGCIS